MSDLSIARRASYDGMSIELLAGLLDYEQFAKAFAERSPVSQERLLLCLTTALSCCNVAVAQFLFENKHVDAENVKRQSLPFQCIEWSGKGARGIDMIQLLLENHIDFTSALPTLGNRSVIEQLERDGASHSARFLRDILWRRAVASGRVNEEN